MLEAVFTVGCARVIRAFVARASLCLTLNGTSLVSWLHERECQANPALPDMSPPADFSRLTR
jgi:hypothetical protein